MGLRGRLILSFVLVIVICLGVIASSLLFLSGETLDRLATARLSDMTLPVYVQVRMLLRGQTSLDQVWANLDEQSKETGISIFLVDSEGTVIRQTSGVEISPVLPGAILPKKPTSGVRSIRGIYSGMDGKSFIYVAFPLAGMWRIKDTGGADWLIFAASRSGATQILNELVRPFVLAGLIALILSIVIAILLARSVYKPIERVKRAAIEMSRGKYEQEVPVNGSKEVRELAKSFNDMAKQVKNSQQTLRDFVADVSHELRTPLTSIRGFAQAIQDGTAQTKESLTKAACIIEDEARRMIRLVNNLLELSRLESGQVEMKKELVDLKEVIHQCQEVFGMRAEEKQIFLVTDMEPMTPVLGDIDRLEQVFNNLLDNAIKHTPQRGTIAIRGRQPTAETIEIAVIDTGPGIAKDQLQHVFDRFYRAEDPAERSGTGLGLAISRQIVLAHGGDIKVDSTPDKGAEFTVRLPAVNTLKDEWEHLVGKGKA